MKMLANQTSKAHPIKEEMNCEFTHKQLKRILNHVIFLSHPNSNFTSILCKCRH